MRAQLLLFWCFFSFCAQAQESRVWEQYLNQVMSIDDVESSSFSRTYDLLCELEQHPLDLNHASREQLFLPSRLKSYWNTSIATGR